MEVYTSDIGCYIDSYMYKSWCYQLYRNVMKHFSKHFTLEELEHSDTAELFNIKNIAPTSAVNNLQKLVDEVLEPLRMHFNAPVRISSGYRSRSLNTLVGGVRNSYHLQGRAADIACVKGHTMQEVYDYIRDYLPHTELLLEPLDRRNRRNKWVHVAL